VFPFYFDAGFSRHFFAFIFFIFLLAVGNEGEQQQTGNVCGLPFAALCVFPAAAEKRGNSGKSWDHLPQKQLPC